jgi:predicted ATP-dependent Lon-type protease
VSNVRKFVRDENVKLVKARLKTETDPHEIKRLEAMIDDEEEIYASALRTIKDAGVPGGKG